MALTLWGKNYEPLPLRQIAGELENQLKQIDDVSETKIIGGLPRQVRVVLDTHASPLMAITAGAVTAQLEQANSRAMPEALRTTTRSSRSKPAVFWAARTI